MARERPGGEAGWTIMLHVEQAELRTILYLTEVGH